MTADPDAEKAREIVRDPAWVSGAHPNFDMLVARFAAALRSAREEERAKSRRYCANCPGEVADWNDGPPETCCHCHEPVYGTAMEAVGKAVAVERERCARIAETHDHYPNHGHDGSCTDHQRREIAKAIREESPGGGGGK